MNSNLQSKACFFMASMLVIYKREDQNKQRHVNVMLQSPKIQILKDDLSHIQRAAIARVNTENNVDPADVVDVVILNIIPLAQCTLDEFNNKETNEVSPIRGH